MYTKPAPSREVPHSPSGFIPQLINLFFFFPHGITLHRNLNTFVSWEHSDVIQLLSEALNDQQNYPKYALILLSKPNALISLKQNSLYWDWSASSIFSSTKNSQEILLFHPGSEGKEAEVSEIPTETESHVLTRSGSSLVFSHLFLFLSSHRLPLQKWKVLPATVVNLLTLVEFSRSAASHERLQR